MVAFVKLNTFQDSLKRTLMTTFGAIKSPLRLQCTITFIVVLVNNVFNFLIYDHLVDKAEP